MRPISLAGASIFVLGSVLLGGTAANAEVDTDIFDESLVPTCIDGVVTGATFNATVNFTATDGETAFVVVTWADDGAELGTNAEDITSNPFTFTYVWEPEATLTGTFAFDINVVEDWADGPLVSVSAGSVTLGAACGDVDPELPPTEEPGTVDPDPGVVVPPTVEEKLDNKAGNTGNVFVASGNPETSFMIVGMVLGGLALLVGTGWFVKNRRQSTQD